MPAEAGEAIEETQLHEIAEAEVGEGAEVARQLVALAISHSLLLPHLRVAQEVVERKQHAEDEAGLAVKEPGPEEVVVAEADERPTRQMRMDALEAALDPT